MSGSASDPNKVPVDRAALAQQEKALGLFQKIWNDANVGESVRRRAKELDATVEIPDDHPLIANANAKAAQADEKVSALSKAFDEYKTKAEQDRQEASLRKTLGEVQTKFGFSDEAMQKTIGIMQERSIADPEAAALVYRESLPKPGPASASSGFLDPRPNLFGTQVKDDAWEKLHTDEPGFFRDVVEQVFAEYPPGVG